MCYSKREKINKPTWNTYDFDSSMAAINATPVKPAKRERTSNKESVNDFCRLCKCALKRKFGDFKKIEYISTENLFKESNRKGCSSRPLAELCEELIGTPVEKSCRLSDRVCKACGRKVRNAQAVQKLVLAINDTNRSGENEADGDRFKRQLPTTVNSPNHSAQKGKVQKLQIKLVHLLKRCC